MSLFLSLKVAVQILAVGLPILASVLDYKWRDKRTKLFRRGRNALFTIACLLLAGSVSLTIWDYGRAEAEAEQLRADRRAVQLRLSDLQIQAADFKKSLAPFLSLASQRFPSQETSRSLESLLEYVKTLESRTQSLESELAPRALSESQLRVLGSGLSALRGEKVGIQSVASDAEAAAFAKQLGGVLTAAGLSVRYMPSYISMPPHTGLRVATGSNADDQPLVRVLIEAFRKAGFTMKASKRPEVGEQILIMVDSKR